MEILNGNDFWSNFLETFVLCLIGLLLLLLLWKCVCWLWRRFQKLEKNQRRYIKLCAVLVMAAAVSLALLADSYADPDRFNTYELENVKPELVQGIIRSASGPMMREDTASRMQENSNMPQEMYDHLTREPDFSDVGEGTIIRCSNGEYYLMFEGDGRLFCSRITRSFSKYHTQGYSASSLNNFPDVEMQGTGNSSSGISIRRKYSEPWVRYGKIKNPDIVKLEYYDASHNLIDIYWADPGEGAPQATRNPYFVFSDGKNTSGSTFGVLVGYDRDGNVIMSHAH